MKTMRNTLGTTCRIAALAIAAVATFHLGIPTVQAEPQDEMFVVDVAVDHDTFAIIPSTGLVLHPQALGPNRGTPFIVDGKIFPGGTLETGSGVGDPNQPGSIGSWMCRGTFTSTLATEDIGFDTVQMFQFGDGNNVWTEGLEGGLGKIGVTTHRTIVGGTGRFKGAEGEVTQEALGTNVTGTPNIRLTFQIVKH
jgi:hypothetical protein